MSSRCRTELLLACATLLVAGCNLDLDLGNLDLGPRPAKKSPNATADDGGDEDDDSAPLTPDPTKKKKAPAKGAIDLGIAVYPDDTPTKNAQAFSWYVPPTVKAGFRLSDAEYVSVEKDYSQFAKSVGFKAKGDKTFSWSPPIGCPSDFKCIYQNLIKRAKPDLAPLIKKFRAQFEKDGTDSLGAAKNLLSFVQSITYEIPNDEPFGLRPPPIVLAKKKGDCDSKALLLFIMLGAFEIPSVIISSQAHSHTMVGIALPSSGSSFRYEGRNYAFAEVTAIGASLGWLAPDLKSPNDWKVELAQ